MKLVIPPIADGQRLDRWLKKALPEVPYVAVQKMLRTGDIRVDGKRAKGDARLVAGQVVEVGGSRNKGQGARENGASVYQITNADKAMLNQAVVYEDDAVLVLNKPAGLAAQAGSGVSRSLDRLVAAMWPKNPPKLTHRLDKDTTGLIVLAKTRAAAQAVTAAFAGRDVRKTYRVLVVGKVPTPTGVVDAAIAKIAHSYGSHAVVDDLMGDEARTEWRVIADRGPYTLLHAMPYTGRMNQIRVHMAHVGCPLVGDRKYGGEAAEHAAAALGYPKTLYLHAERLVLPHPVTGQVLELSAPLPPHFAALT
ncbi:MAG: RluA family pseudouridine synthase [Alphaproteobacteria bacterium]